MFLFLIIVAVIIGILIWGRIGNQEAHNKRINSNREDLVRNIPTDVQMKSIDEVDEQDIKKIKINLKKDKFTRDGINSIVSSINQAREGDFLRFESMFGDINKVFRGVSDSVNRKENELSEERAYFERGDRYATSRELFNSSVFIPNSEAKDIVEKGNHKILEARIIWIGRRAGKKFAHIGVMLEKELGKINNIQMEMEGELAIDYKDLCYEVRTSIAYEDKFEQKETSMDPGKMVEVDISVGRDDEFGDVFETYVR